MVYEGTDGVTLKGTARDTDGDRLSYSLEQTAGESAVLSDAIWSTKVQCS